MRTPPPKTDGNSTELPYQISAPYFTEISKSDYSLSVRTLFIIPLVLMSVVSFPSWGLTVDDLVYRTGLFYKKFTSTPFNGEIDEGLQRGSIKNGKKDGAWDYFYNNGQLWGKGEYKNGEKQGSWEGYHESGRLNYKGNYTNGKSEGDWSFYHANGQLSSEGDFKNDKKEGAWEFYFENGQLWKKGNYKNGKKEGLWVRHLSNGQLISKGAYKDDKEDGEWVSYTFDGEVFPGLTGNYRNGVKVSD